MRFIPILGFLFIHVFVFGQEVESPLLYETRGSKETNFQTKINTGTFDSTFIYSTDTIGLPLFDDFSSNKIQQYAADYSDPGVTFEKYYRLLSLGDVPLSNDTLYTLQPTFRSVFNTATGETTQEPYPSISIKVGELDTYPPVYETKEVYPPYYVFDTIGVADVSDTVFISGPSIYQDSATQFFATVVDPSLIWLDDDAYHNYRYPVNPWSLGVMTFDGLDRTGYPYQIGTSISNYGDYLTSKPISLQGVTTADSVYITFLAQSGGYGDPTEPNDSLILEFYNPVAQQWQWQWSMKGGADGDFKLGHIVLDNPDYMQNGFQFRFKNYGGLSGNLDHFHLDYVHLRDFSGYQDTLIEDFALVYPIPTLLKDYTQVPWDHYQNNFSGKMSTDAEVVVRNSYLNGESNISSSAGGNIDVYYNGSLEGNVPLNGQVLANYNPPSQPIPDYQPRTTYSSNHDVSTYSFDPLKVGTQQLFDIKVSASVPVGSNFLPNDTAYSQQAFRNYYAYDDGSAERAYGVEGSEGTQPRLAVQYTPYEADSLIGIRVHFVPTVDDITNKLFQITVWDDNGGVPGLVLYQDDPFTPRQPIYETSHNKFVTYLFNDNVKIPVDGTFYVGWKQIDNERFTVGNDKNINNNSHTFYSLNGEVSWSTSTISGSIMINPIFSTAMDAELGIETPKQESIEVTIYPNPSSGLFHVKTSNHSEYEIEVYSMLGQYMLTATDNTIDLTNYPNGVYFVKLKGQVSSTYKIIKR